MEICGSFAVVQQAPDEMTPDEQFAALEAYEKFWARFESVRKLRQRCIRLSHIGFIPEYELMNSVLTMIHNRVGLVHNYKIYLGDLEIISRQYDISPMGLKKGLLLLKENDFVIEEPKDWYRLNV